MAVYPPEGSVVAIPILPESWVAGVYTRTKKGRGKRVPFGYFFGKVHSAPEEICLGELNAADAVLKCRFGDLGLEQGKWRLIGKITPWNRSDWPMPDFMISGADPFMRLPWDQLLRFDENDRNIEIARERHPVGTLQLSLAAVPGSVALEHKLAKIVFGIEPPRVLR
jgi:hypothetical protein